MRRQVMLLGAVFIAEAALYSALAPLLASYARNGEISKIAAGALNGAYAFGLIPGGLAAGQLTNRLGSRRTTILGTAVFAASTAWFGTATAIDTQTVARAVQGLAAGCMWGGALAWLINAAPIRRRGEFIGIATGASMLGSIVGPAIGILTVELGKETAYLGSAAAIAALIIPLYLTPSRQPVTRQTGLLTKSITSSALRAGSWLTLLGSAAFAILLTLLPLRLESAGATPTEVGIVFLSASILSSVLATFSGRLSDRRDATRTTQIGLLMTAMIFGILSVKLPLIPLATTTIVATLVLILGLFVPAERLLVDGAAKRGFAPGTSAPILILCIAVGESLGAPGGAAIATAASESAPFLTIAAVMIASAYLMRAGAKRRTVAVPHGER